VLADPMLVDPLLADLLLADFEGILALICGDDWQLSSVEFCSDFGNRTKFDRIIVEML